MNRIKTVLAYAFVAVLMWAAFSSVSDAKEFDIEKHYSVSFLACDSKGHCERMKRPLDADNPVHCMIKAGMVGAVEWLKEHPDWRLSEVHCAAEGENDL